MSAGKAFYGLGILTTGIGLGAMIALLYAPQSGKQTRKAISRTAEEGMHLVSERGREICKQAEQAFEKGKGVALRLVA